jgi:hypothetical protein
MPSVSSIDDRPRPVPAWYAPLLAAILVGATLYGLLSDTAYRVADDVAAQGRGQDLLTLMAVPVLLWAAGRARAGSFRAHLVWVGLLLYVAYTYASYAFGVPFNAAFLLYVAALGLASYGLLDGLLRIDVDAVAPAFADTPRRETSVVLLVSGALFAFVWLADVVTALPDGLPEARMAYDLPNPIHVLDLAWLIPAVVATGVLLRRRHPAAGVLAAVLLIKLLTLSLAIAYMVAFTVADGGAVDPVVTTVFATLGVAAAWLLSIGHRRLGAVHDPWLAHSIFFIDRSHPSAGGSCPSGRRRGQGARR